jgi:hypothetical protein
VLSCAFFSHSTPPLLFYCRQISFFYTLPYLFPHDGALSSARDVSLYPLYFCHSARPHFTPLKRTHSHCSITHYLPRPLVQIIFAYFSPFHFYTCSPLPPCSKYRHIVSTPTSAISYASVSHMMLPVRHALVPPHKFCVCVCVYVCLFPILLCRLHTRCWTEISFSTC